MNVSSVYTFIMFYVMLEGTTKGKGKSKAISVTGREGP
jgi:hypothetical protein